MNSYFRLLYHTSLFLFPISLYAQTSTIKVRKPQHDSINIVGSWTPLFDKDAKGKVSKINQREMDTLTFFPNNKYVKNQIGQEVGIWDVDQKNRIINYRNGIFTCTIDGTIMNIDMNGGWERVGKTTKDTMTFIRALEETPNTGYKTRYYIRIK